MKTASRKQNEVQLAWRKATYHRHPSVGRRGARGGPSRTGQTRPIIAVPSDDFTHNLKSNCFKWFPITFAKIKHGWTLINTDEGQKPRTRTRTRRIQGRSNRVKVLAAGGGDKKLRMTKSMRKRKIENWVTVSQTVGRKRMLVCGWLDRGFPMVSNGFQWFPITFLKI